jgi:HTH-type transcriptional regulator/antitoxin HigA
MSLSHQVMIEYINPETHHELHLPLSVLKAPRNDREYAALERVLDQLIDEVRDDESHDLAITMEIIGNNLEAYDSQHHPAIGENVSDAQMVSYLMHKNNLHQHDLASIFGGQANVSKFLNGERQLNRKQIAGLKAFFGISADFFIRG